MIEYSIKTELPIGVKLPLNFREKGGELEGSVNHPIELIKKFEPVDILDGATELIDQAGNIITIHADNPYILETNEYPKDFEGITYQIISRENGESK